MQLNICFIGRAIFRCYRAVVSGSKPLLIKGGVGRIVGIGKAEGHPSLYAKGLQGGLLRWFGRGIGYCASRGSLRDADPFVATGLPANFSTSPNDPEGVLFYV